MSYQDVKDKLYHGHRKIANNTYLKLQPAYYEDEFVVMELHGNLIATFHPDYLELWSAGWYTPTTKDRLNLALATAKTEYVANVEYPYWRKIYQVSGQWYYGNHHKTDPKFYSGMKIGYDGKIIKEA